MTHIMNTKSSRRNRHKYPKGPTKHHSLKGQDLIDLVNEMLDQEWRYPEDDILWKMIPKEKKKEET